MREDLRRKLLIELATQEAAEMNYGKHGTANSPVDNPADNNNDLLGRQISYLAKKDRTNLRHKRCVELTTQEAAALNSDRPCNGQRSAHLNLG
jgi:hypothetical protein